MKKPDTLADYFSWGLASPIIVAAAVTAAWACGPSGGKASYPAGISFMREMAYIPHVDGWQQCQPGRYAADSQVAAAAWDTLHPWVQKQYSAATLRALSGWAKKEMAAYKRVPKLKGLTFVPVRELAEHKKVTFEAVVEKLPAHQANVTRYHLIYLLYDTATREVVSVTVTIRGKVLE
jgi:hypothetical protein